MNERHGFRGYIASRAVRGSHVPQRVQNLVVRDYCTRAHLQYRLSAVEYVMPSCYMMLESILDELPKIRGLVAFSLFMLPTAAPRRRRIVDRVLASDGELHFALENLAIRKRDDVAACEDILGVDAALNRCPFEGFYPTMLQSDREVAFLLARAGTLER
jgi:sporadic carbohydrate cluster protein (TIGR04323 family)